MPVTYRFEDNVIWLETVGQVPHDDISAAIGNVVNDPNFKTGMRFVLDVQHFIGNPSVQQVQSRVGTLSSLRDKIAPVIVVVVSNDFHFGIGRMFEVYANRSGFEVEIFKQEEQAREWLQFTEKKRRQPDACL